MIIKKKMSMENLISRIPGLFPYILEDSYGIIKLHKAIDGDNGCYGKVIPDLKVNFTMTNPDNDNIVVFESGKFYSYRTLMNNYYRLKSLNRTLIISENALISYIEEGMGIFSVPSTIKGKLVPSFMFLVEMQEWWEWFQMMKPRCDCSKTPSNINDNDCCACAEYCDKGGNDMYDFLQSNVNKIDTIASKYYNYALNNSGGFGGSINMSLLLTQNIDDMGIGLTYSSEWVPGKKYHVGEIVLYNEESWILYEGSGGTSFTLCQMNDNNKFDEGFDYYGNYNGKIDEIEFDSAENAHWRRNVTNDISYLPTNCQYKFYKTNTGTNIDLLPINSYYVKDNDSYDKLLASTIDDVEITGSTNSKLTSLRRMKRLVDESGQESTPNSESNVDWCCLYEKGIVLNIQTWVDDNGNIVYYDNWEDMTVHNIQSPGNMVNTVTYSNSLIAFGDILEDIKLGDNNTIIFSYCIGAHLIGNGINTLTSTTEPTQYRFSDFTIDSNHKGIQYVETYYYDPDTFDYNVTKSPTENLNGDGTQKKGEFYTVGSKTLIKSELGNSGKILNNILTDFTTKRTEPDYIYSKEYRTDDLIGVTFDPIVDVNVVVDRGINAAFERHLKLGEVKTLDDLVNYGNNFFNVKNVNE